MKFKSKIIYFLLFSILFVFTPVTANAEKTPTKRTTIEGLRKTAQKAELSQKSNINKFTGRVIGVGLSLIGVVFFILVVYGGIVYMTSHGNEEQAKRGRDTIIAASVCDFSVGGLCNYQFRYRCFSGWCGIEWYGGKASKISNNYA
ncbi:MAG: hypothetical protein ABEJ24_00105 [Candidatus Magasanikbacteria bacterium]